MVFNTTFNNISVISWWSVLLVEETGEPGENHWPVASHWQTLSNEVVSSTLSYDHHIPQLIFSINNLLLAVFALIHSTNSSNGTLLYSPIIDHWCWRLDRPWNVIPATITATIPSCLSRLPIQPNIYKHWY